MTNLENYSNRMYLYFKIKSDCEKKNCKLRFLK